MSVSALVEKLYSKDKAARMLAIRSLGQIGAGAATAIPDLVELVDDADKDISSLSLGHSRLLAQNKCLKPKLVEMLRDPCPRMRQMAAFALGAMGDDGRDAVPSLAFMLKDEDRGVQMHAMLALSRVAGVQKWQLCSIGLSMLKTPKHRASLEIFAPPPYRLGYDHDCVRPPFRPLFPLS